MPNPMKAKTCPNDETCVSFMDDTLDRASIQVNCHLGWCLCQEPHDAIVGSEDYLHS